MANPPVLTRPNPVLIKAAREKKLNLKELLEQAIKASLDKCPMCGHKIKRKPKSESK